MGKGNKLSQGSRHVVRENFLNMAINGIGPVKLLVRKSGEIRLFGLEANGSMLHLDKVSDNMLDSFKVPFSWGDPEPRHHCHNGGGDVNSSQGHRPLESTNKRLVVFMLLASDMSSSG